MNNIFQVLKKIGLSHKTLIIFLILLSSNIAHASENQNTLIVEGVGIYKIDANIMHVNLAVEIEGSNLAELQDRLNKLTNNVTDSLNRYKNLGATNSSDINKGIRNISIDNLNIRTKYSNDRNREAIGFVAISNISFESDIEHGGKFIDEAIKAGATRIDNVILKASADSHENARNNSLKLASTDALNQAKIVLDALNLNILGVEEIFVNKPQQPIQPRMLMRMESVDSAMNFSPKELEVKSMVTLKVRYSKK